MRPWKTEPREENGNPSSRGAGRAAIGATVVAAALLATAISGCKKEPAAGGSCELASEGEVTCLDAKTALLCSNLRLSPLPCRGEKGCSITGNVAVCDVTVAKEGDACDPKTESDYDGARDRTCAEDGKSALACREGKFAVDRLCRGEKGCDPVAVRKGELSACDRSLAEMGDPCEPRRFAGNGETEGICSVDRKNALVCDGAERGHFVLGRSCGGPKGCGVVAATPSRDYPLSACDESVATLGAPCGKPQADSATCSADGAVVLKCDKDSLTWAKVKDCQQGTKCAYRTGDVILSDLECAPSP
ncbi:MAG: hypothetical protein R3B70_48945 [Polyangiaceae bacterium]